MIRLVRRDGASVTKITVLATAPFVVSNGNNIVACIFLGCAANDVKGDKLPLETEPVSRDNNTS